MRTTRVNLRRGNAEAWNAKRLFENWIDYLGRPGQAKARAGTHNHESMRWPTLGRQLNQQEAFVNMGPCVRRDDSFRRRLPHIPVWPISVAWP
jgi:hypothetical protein